MRSVSTPLHDKAGNEGGVVVELQIGPGIRPFIKDMRKWNFFRSPCIGVMMSEHRQTRHRLSNW